MRAKEFVPAFSEVLGLPPETVKVADRSLADNGMRAKGRGPKPPHVTVPDALRLMLGLMSETRYVSRLHEAVADLEGFFYLDVAVDKGRALMTDDFFKTAFGFGVGDLKGMKLIEALDCMIQHFAAGHKPRFGVWIEVTEHGPVHLQFDANEVKGEIIFTGVQTKISHPGLTRVSTVGPYVLNWIADNIVQEVAA